MAESFRRDVDAFVVAMGWDFPIEGGIDDVAIVGEPGTPTVELDLRAAGIASIIWATGYSPDFNWVNISVFDEYEYPVQRRGVTALPGLYFVGLPWLHTARSGLLGGVGEDAAFIVNHLISRRELLLANS